ncbi:hypothetical protein ACOSQ3_003583 [Xanthoceras sorbifolium]
MGVLHGPLLCLSLGPAVWASPMPLSWASLGPADWASFRDLAWVPLLGLLSGPLLDLLKIQASQTQQITAATLITIELINELLVYITWTNVSIAAILGILLGSS